MATLYTNPLAVGWQMPRGTNNRVNEQNTNRNNNNRLFDSQNNNKGGYSVGVDEDDYAGTVTVPPQGPMRFGDPNQGIASSTYSCVHEDANTGRRRMQNEDATPAYCTTGTGAGKLTLGATNTQTQSGYNEPPMEMELGTVLPIEWTSQHACGPNDKTSCEIIMQYGCDATTPSAGMPGLRDGTNTGCPNNGDQCPPLNNDEDADDDTSTTAYGQHESPVWYQECRTRGRNKGLFTADRNMNNRNQARSTRQNPNGGRSGTECPEERDYYPYWVATPWRDIAVLTSNISRCQYYSEQTQNTRGRLNPNGQGARPPWCMLDNGCDTAACEACNDEACVLTECTCSDCNDISAKPVCMEAFWNRDNHLGGGVGGQANLFNWTLPTKTTGLRAGPASTDAEADAAEEFDRCVFRMRYNITTGDTDLDYESSIAYWDLTSQYNGDDSPVEQDEAVKVPGAEEPTNVGRFDGAAARGGGSDQDGVTRTLQLALNTNQYGRIFEDRSMVFHLVDFDKRGELLSRRRLQKDVKLTEDGLRGYEEDISCDVVHNLEVRGKRGNIVQSYPSVEHDFDPSPLIAETGDCIELTIHLTDNDPPNNAGEGLPGSGRANLALTETGDKNIPVTDFTNPVARPNELFPNEEAMFRWSYLGQESLKRTGQDAAACLPESEIEDNNEEQNVRNCGKLNPVGPEYSAGRIELQNAGTWHFMSTRENNFSNRSHKSQIIVVEGLGTGEMIGITLAGVAGLAVIGAAASFGFKKKKAGGAMPTLPCASKPGGAPEPSSRTPAQAGARGAAPARPKTDRIGLPNRP